MYWYFLGASITEMKFIGDGLLQYTASLPWGLASRMLLNIPTSTTPPIPLYDPLLLRVKKVLYPISGMFFKTLDAPSVSSGPVQERQLRTASRLTEIVRSVPISGCKNVSPHTQRCILQ